MSAIGSILTNEGALAALNSIASTTAGLDATSAQISTGLAINSPADNPAGYITAQGFTSEVGGLTQAMSNMNEGISLAQTAGGAIQQQIDMAQKLYSIAVQAANGTETADQRQSLQGVASQLIGEINNIATQTKFNGINLLDGTFRGIQFQIGANSGQSTTLSIGNTKTSAIGSGRLDGSFKSEPISSLVRTNRSNTTGIFSGSFTIKGSKGSATIGVTSRLESARSIAQAINAVSSETGVTASASTSVTYSLLTTGVNGSARPAWGFNLISSSGVASTNPDPGVPAPYIYSTNAASLATIINSQTSKTGGITATTNTAGSQITFSQASGGDIEVGTTSTTRQMVTSSGVARVSNTARAAALSTQGTISLQSSAAFQIVNGSHIGLTNNVVLQGGGNQDYALAGIDLSTASGAEHAINVIAGAITQLGEIGAEVGAFQDGLSGLVLNTSQSESNATSALGVVQDANLPAETNTLSEEEIRSQSGVAALKNSSALQQSFLRLLP